MHSLIFNLFFFNDTATTEIYTLSLHDALPISRFYEEDNGELHIRSDFLIDDDEDPRSVRVAFIVNEHNKNLRSCGVLFSIHDEDVPVFRLLRMREIGRAHV